MQAFNGEPVADAAFLANAAWAGDPNTTPGSPGLATYLSSTGSQVLPDHVGWKPLTSAQLKNLHGLGADDFYRSANAVAFAATKGDTLAISIRGIQGPFDSQGAISALGDPPDYYQNVLPLINAAISYANLPQNQNIQHIIITGASLGGETAQLFAVDPSSLGRFSAPDISIITFGSPGIPSSLNIYNSPLENRVLDIYNSADPIYNHALVFSVFNNLRFTHIGTPKELYTPNMDYLSPTVIAHQPSTYQAEIEAFADSKLSDFASPSTVLIFGGDDSSITSTTTITASSLDSQLGLSSAPQHFLSDLGGNTTMYGDSGNDLLNGRSGNDVMTGGAMTNPVTQQITEHNQYAFLSGNDTITNFNPQKDALWLPGGTTTGTLVNGSDSVLSYPGGGAITLDGVDLGPVASQYSWLHWE